MDAMNRHPSSGTAQLTLLLALLVFLAACKEGPNPDPGAPELDASAESMQVHPRGELFPFMGYSGVPERDAANGFSVAGPNYAEDQIAQLAAAEAAGLSYPYKVGIKMNFLAKAPEKPVELSEEEIKQRITAQVREVAGRESICWWYLGPEELRHWRKNEMTYLKAATEAIRAADPLQRPIWMYEPNHREAASLELTGQYLDVIGKGFYTNLAGYQNHRIWVRWSMEQQIEAIEALEKKDGRRRTPLVMPELCADPEDPADDHLIPTWARHDTYLGLMSGGEGVAIWSLFPRAEVKRTWPIWYHAYSQLATELTGPLQLGRIFLHGTDLEAPGFQVLSGPKELPLTKGSKNELEEGTTSASEKKEGRITYPALGVRRLSHGGHTWIFLCNSSGTETIKFQSAALPEGSVATDVFAYKPVDLSRSKGRLYGWLGPLEVRCYRLTSR